MFLPSTAAHMLAMENFAFDKLKSSRRKQSKPIRVSYSAENDGTAPPNPGAAPGTFPGVMPVPQSMEEGEEYINGRDGVESGSDHGQEDEESSLSPKLNTNSEEMHHQERITPLSEHMNQLNQRSSSEEKMAMPPHRLPKEMEMLMEAFPTKYHRLGSELFQGNFVPNGHSENKNEQSTDSPAKNGNGNDEMDAMSVSSKSGGPDPNEEGRKLDGSSRIFHQDAYCEICDREFCNKYFLKTHKANKHGIFDNSPSPFSMGALPPSMPLPQDPSPPLSSSMPNSMPTSMSLQQSQTLPPSTSSSSFKVMDFIQNLPPSEPKTPKQDLLPQMPNKPSESGADTNSTPTSGTKPGKDMEDFCELCQKHFCNKYYLKKHKQDVHGIAPPDGSSSGKRGGSRSKDLQAQLDAITSSAVAAATSAAASPLIPHSMANMPGLPNMPGVMVLNPFMGPMLIPGGALMPPQSPLTAPRMSQLPPVLVSSAMSPPESSATSITTSSSPSGTVVSDSLRGIGVLNAEAYCELCQKEFCNKYFLKIHKANKHGMFLDEFPFGPPGMPYKLPSSDSTMNTSETPISSSAMEGQVSKDHSKMETSPKPGTSLITSSANQENYVTYCNLCNQEFSSKYTYRIHRIQVHGMLNEGLDSSLTDEIVRSSFREKEREEAAKISPGSRLAMEEHQSMIDGRMAENGMTTMFGNMVAAKLADRVTCDICNKELCNKYFLKVHKFKVHGVDTTLQDQMDAANKSSKLQLTGDFETIKNGMPYKPERAHQSMGQVKSEPKEFLLHSPQLPTSLPLPGLPKASEAPTDLSPNSALEKPSHEELVKMGIDPDAYCEICKKEFCSKYFLRTHRQNIHGIKSDKPESVDPDRAFLAAIVAANNNNKPLNLSMSGKKAKNGFEKHTWRWKEPVNSSRVSCEICNKELCNKYFLRTHKLNKHGILPSESSLSPSCNNSPTTSDIETSSNSSLPTDLSVHDRSNFSPQAIRLEGNMRFNSLYNMEDKLKAYNMEDKLKAYNMEDKLKAYNMEDKLKAYNMEDKLKTYNMEEKLKAYNMEEKLRAYNMEERLKALNSEEKLKGYSMDEKLKQAKSGDGKSEDDISAGKHYLNNYSEVCYLCDRRFKTSKWLKAHIIKDHAGMAPTGNMNMDCKKSLYNSSYDANMDQRMCRLCDVLFPSELSMHLHMIQEHNAQVALNTSSSPECEQPAAQQKRFPGFKRRFALRRRFSFVTKQKLYSCSVCDYKSKWLTNVCSHEVKSHGINKLEGTSTNRLRGQDMLVKSNDKGMKSFRCMTCNRSFPSPILCHHHIREEHIRRKDFKLNNKLPNTRVSCTLCHFSTRYPKQLRQHMARAHTNGKLGAPTQGNGLSTEKQHSGINRSESLFAQDFGKDAENGEDGRLSPCEEGRLPSCEKQAFQIEDCSSESDFLTSMVKIPVRRHVNTPMTVTFLLTPMEQ